MHVKTFYGRNKNFAKEMKDRFTLSTVFSFKQKKGVYMTQCMVSFGNRQQAQHCSMGDHGYEVLISLAQLMTSR